MGNPLGTPLGQRSHDGGERVALGSTAAGPSRRPRQVVGPAHFARRAAEREPGHVHAQDPEQGAQAGGYADGHEVEEEHEAVCQRGLGRREARPAAHISVTVAAVTGPQMCTEKLFPGAFENSVTKGDRGQWLR